jgi:hypothetical protein
MTPFTYKVFFTTEYANSSINSYKSSFYTRGSPYYIPVTVDFLESNGSVLKNNLTETEDWRGLTRIGDSISYSETYSFSIWGPSGSSGGSSTSGTFPPPPQTSIQPYTYTTNKTTTQTTSTPSSILTFAQVTTQVSAYSTATTRRDSLATTSEATTIYTTRQWDTSIQTGASFNFYYTTTATESTSYWNTHTLDASTVFIANGLVCAEITGTGFGLFAQLFSTFSNNRTIEPSYLGTIVSTSERLKANLFSSDPDTRLFSFTNTFGDHDKGKNATVGEWQTLSYIYVFFGTSAYEPTQAQTLTIGNAQKSTFSVDVAARTEARVAFATQSKTIFLSKFAGKKYLKFFSDGLEAFQSSVFTLAGTTVVTTTAPFVFTQDVPGNATLAIDITDTFTTYTSSRFVFQSMRNNTSAEIKTLPALLRREYTGLTRTETSYAENIFAYAELAPHTTFLEEPRIRAAYPFGHIVRPTESRSGVLGDSSYTHSYSGKSITEFELCTYSDATISASRSAAIVLKGELPTIPALWGNSSRNGVPTHAVRYGLKEGVYFVADSAGTSYRTITEDNTFLGNGNALRIVPLPAFSASFNHEMLDNEPFTFSVLSRYQAAEPLL